MNDAPAPSPQPQPQAQPVKLPFPVQPGEQILEVCYRHWLYLWPSIILKLIAALVPPSAIAFALSAAGAYHGLGAKIFWVVAGIYLLYWLAQIFLAWYRYHNDIWVITNQRVVDYYKSNPLKMRMSTADLVNIQDMTVQRDGLLRTALNYGDILCQTAAEQQEFRFTGVPHPDAIQALVDHQRDLARGSR